MTVTDAELSAYLDEALDPERSAEIEKLLRSRPDLLNRAALLARRRDQGGHTLGEIWRRHRLSCPSRAELGRYLLSAAPPGLEDYIRFHVQTIGCRFCQANIEDLETALAGATSDRQARHRRYFESSAGLLRSRRGDE